MTKDVRQQVRRYRWRQQLPWLWNDVLYQRYESDWAYYAGPRHSLVQRFVEWPHDETVPSDPDWGDL